VGLEGKVLERYVLMAWYTPPGTPKPQVMWRKGPSLEPLSGRPGVAVLDDGSLFLSSVSPMDSGDYECQATNEVGLASRRTTLVVYGKWDPRTGGQVRKAGVSGTSLCQPSWWPPARVTQSDARV
jgi:hemicentin